MRLRIASLMLAPILPASALLFACSSFTAEEDAPPVVTREASTGDAYVAPPACPSGALLCDHFERGADLLSPPWKPMAFGDTRIILDLDPTTSTTGTTSFKAHDQGIGGTGALVLDVTPELPIRIELDLRISRVQPLPTLLFQYLFNATATAVSVAVEEKGIKITEQVGPTKYFETPTLPFPTNEWTHLIFTFDKNKLAVLELPGAKKVQRTIVNPTDTASAVRVGLPYVQSHDEGEPFDVWYDDIVITR